MTFVCNRYQCFDFSGRNSHSVPLDVIEARLRQYHPMIPFYFGLFLNHEQTSSVLQQAYDYYQQAFAPFLRSHKPAQNGMHDNGALLPA